MRALLAAYPEAHRLYIILDNAKVHSSLKTQKALAEWGESVVLHFLLPYCPSANLIERVWWDVQTNVTRSHRCKSLEESLNEVDAYLEGRNTQGTSSPTLSSGPIRSAA